MENILLTLVIILLVVVIFLLVAAIFLGLKLLKSRESASLKSKQDSNYHPEIVKRMEEAKHIKNIALNEATCHLHPKEPSEGACAICDRYFCRHCLKSHQNLNFCKEHINLFLNNEWSEVFTLKSTPDDPEAGVRVVEWKKQQWLNNEQPLFIQTHYKINVDGDQIESWVVLFSRTTDKEKIKEQLANFIS